VLAQVHQASDADVDAAVASAEAAFPAWAALTGAERGRILNRAAALLRERNDELARIEVADTGKPIAEASTVDVISGAEAVEYFAGAAATLTGDARDAGRQPSSTCAARSRWACVPASAPGTTRSRSPAGSRPRRWPPATRWCSSPPS
jgi:betaine-aldehyde dehydrogenase